MILSLAGSIPKRAFIIGLTEEDFAISYRLGGTETEPKNAGVYQVTIVCSKTDVECESVAVTLTIGKANLTVTANDSSRTQGEANPAFTVTYSGFEDEYPHFKV